MKVTPLEIPGVLLVEPSVFGDARGFFFESFNLRQFEAASGCAPQFVQDNQSRSAQHVLRGLHYQIRQPQAKLVRVLAGTVWHVVVDIRRSSPNRGKWLGTRLSADNKRQIWIPEGFAHGFCVVSDSAEILYKTTDYWAPEHARCIAWNDPELAIDWQLNGAVPILSAKDQQGVPFVNAELFA